MPLTIDVNIHDLNRPEVPRLLRAVRDLHRTAGYAWAFAGAAYVGQSFVNPDEPVWDIIGRRGAGGCDELRAVLRTDAPTLFVDVETNAEHHIAEPRGGILARLGADL